MDGHKIKFLVITATYNAAEVLPRLIASLQAQTDQDFEWIVADGASTDGTLALLEKAGKALNVRVDSRPDFGIYDALNRAVKMVEGDYYLVIGADDELFSDSIARYKSACLTSKADFITARIDVRGKVRNPPLRKHEWLFGMSSYVTSHSVGLLIKRSLHDRFGYYTNKLPIAADHLFVLCALHGGATLHSVNFLAGKFSVTGTSGTDVLGTPSECMRAQVMAGHNIIFQSLLFLMRVFVRSIRKNLIFMDNK